MRKPKLSFWQIWNMSFGFLGIQFGLALQNANVSRIFETLGAKIEEIPILWIAAPLTGLIIQPIIGHMSDNTWTRLGRRRPFFLVGAILASIALLVMPNSPTLWFAAGMLWIMDASINISMEPFRAYVGDMLPQEQRTTGFAMQSFFIGTGSVIASCLPYIFKNWLDIPNTAPAGEIPLSIKYSFYLGGAVFLVSVLWTVFRSHEYSPEELEKFDATEELEDKSSSSQIETRSTEDLKTGAFKFCGISILLGIIITYLIYHFSLSHELYVISGSIIAFGIIQFISASLMNSGKIKNGLVEVYSDLMTMPKTMVQLAVVQFFSWFALFAMWIYSTSAITSHIYGTTDTSSIIYNDGADWVGILFGCYNGFAALFAFLLPVIARHTSRKITHMVSLIAGGVGLISVYFFNDPKLLIISMIGVGLAWASILSMPYAILTGSLPSKKMGVYMGIFNFFIVIPQILAATLLGFFTKDIFDGQAIYTLVLGGVSMIIAAITVLFVNDNNK